MSMETKICPVCGGRTVDSVCPVCGCLLAQRFAGKKSLALWQKHVAQARFLLLQYIQDICTERNVFTLASRQVACILPESGTLLVAGRNGISQPEAGVRQYSATDRNEARLYTDGTVKVTGDNEYQQCSTAYMKEIQQIAAASNCVYGVTRTGTVCASGTAVKAPKMTGVQALSCGYYHIAALLKSGQVLLEPPASIRRSKNVKRIAAEGRDTLLLYRSGRVAVYPDGCPEVEQWRNITAAAMDSAYVVGLTRDGQVLLASRGEGSALLDMGRREAAEWHDIIAISCCRSGIGAIDRDGRLHLAGNIPSRDAIQKHWDGQIAGVLYDELIRLAAARLKEQQ